MQDPEIDVEIPVLMSQCQNTNIRVQGDWHSWAVHSDNNTRQCFQTHMMWRYQNLFAWRLLFAGLVQWAPCINVDSPLWKTLQVHGQA